MCIYRHYFNFGLPAKWPNHGVVRQPPPYSPLCFLQPEVDGSRLLCLPLQWREVDWSTGNNTMVAMTVLCGIRIWYTSLLLLIISGDLAGCIEEGGKSSESLLSLSSGSHSIYACHMFGVRRFRSIQEINGDDFGSGAPVLRATCNNDIVVVKWSNNLYVIFVMFGILYASCEHL